MVRRVITRVKVTKVSHSWSLAFAATLPALPWLTAGLLIGGIIVLAAGVALIVIPVRNASRSS
jgi:uncharacterized membrane protein